jgi:hypothetical protein
MLSGAEAAVHHSIDALECTWDMLALHTVPGIRTDEILDSQKRHPGTTRLGYTISGVDQLARPKSGYGRRLVVGSMRGYESVTVQYNLKFTSTHEYLGKLCVLCETALQNGTS